MGFVGVDEFIKGIKSVTEVFVFPDSGRTEMMLERVLGGPVGRTKAFLYLIVATTIVPLVVSIWHRGSRRTSLRALPTHRRPSRPSHDWPRLRCRRLGYRFVHKDALLAKMMFTNCQGITA